MSKGRYIVIEGAEGTGKTTQILLLADKLRGLGYSVRLFREPDSQSDVTARMLRRITQDPRFPLNTKTEVLLYNAARSQSLQVIKKAREQGVICICDRNYLTTLAIQYYGRADISDYDAIEKIIGFAVDDMEPDFTVVLDAPAQTLYQRAKDRGAGERFDNLDEDFLERVRAGYLWEAKKRGYVVVNALGTPDEIHTSIWQTIQQATTKPATHLNLRSEPPLSVIEPVPTTPTPIADVLDKKADKLGLPVHSHEDAPVLRKTKEGQYEITDAGKEFLEHAVTNNNEDVYAFTEALAPTTIAAAMARLSRRGDDMRITLLDEFAGKAGKDENLLKRVITAYGDDSVQQLVGQHLVIENASNLLTKKLEWGRLAAYLEQSTRYIYFDQKDKNGNYRYFIPKYLPKDLLDIYKKTMDDVFDTYSSMVRLLTDYVRDNSQVPKEEQDIAWQGATRAQACDAVRPILPVATTATVGIYASGQALESLITHLLSDPLPEAYTAGHNLLKEARKVIPAFLERVDIEERGVAAQGYRAFTYQAMKDFAEKNLPQTLSVDHEAITLIDYWPKNELDLIPHMLYEHSHLSLSEIKKEVNNWSYTQKTDALSTYMGERLNRRHRPGRALENAHYSWDLICDYGIFRDLQRHRMVDDLEWQQLTPRYGFDIPELVEKAGLADKFEYCFERSLELYSLLQEKGYTIEAQYATLLGHKMRWKVTYNAREAIHLHELRTSPQGHPGYRKMVLQMHEKLTNVHPLIGESMRFVNKGEDPELTRLAAERYTQSKLNQLSG